MNKRKGCLIPLVALAAIIIIVVIVMLLNPLRRSEEQIRANMLRLTPIGTSMDTVVRAVENNRKWDIVSVSDRGYLVIHGRPSSASGLDEDDKRVIGVKSIRVYLGYYNIIFNTGVSVFYGFDEDSKLIDIAVRKDKDGL
jgi:hypothetical protein